MRHGESKGKTGTAGVERGNARGRGHSTLLFLEPRIVGGNTSDVHKRAQAVANMHGLGASCCEESIPWVLNRNTCASCGGRFRRG